MWLDGREMVADDVFYSWKRLADDSTQTEAWWLMEGTIVGFDGSSWTPPMTTPTGNTLLDVWGCDTAVYAVGPYATVIELVP